MKYLFTLMLLIMAQLTYAQASLLSGIRLATSVGTLAARHSKTKAKQKKDGAASPALASTAGRQAPVTPFTYRGQVVSHQRTKPEMLMGEGAAEILALEDALEQSHQAMLADSVQSFLPAARIRIIAASVRKATVAQPSWNYSAYQQELAFYRQEEARRVKPETASAPAKTTSETHNK